MQFFNNYAQQLSSLTRSVKPLSLKGTKLAFYNSTLHDAIGLPEPLKDETQLLDALFAQSGTFAKNAVAQKYGGHQFGYWNPQLGDGRGLLLAEHVAPNGSLWDLHLKGAGPTPYSRSGDGRAVLRSTIREFLASEALHHLGIPSSRALCLLTSEQAVQRETQEPAAMLIRVCQSHIRFGHFEYFHHSQQPEKLQALFDFCFEHHFASLKQQQNPYLSMLKKVIEDTALMLAKWQVYGFNHGVMNTDNMSIHGITFDFGPYAFMDDFFSDYICNHTDQQGRYAFDQQPGIALWNLNAFAHAFLDYVPEKDITTALSTFEPIMLNHFYRLMCRRLGLVTDSNETALTPPYKETTKHLIFDWLQQLNKEHRDYNQTHRHLLNAVINADKQRLTDYFIDEQWANDWFTTYQKHVLKLNLDKEQQEHTLCTSNPVYILRNHYAQQAIDAAHNNDFSVFEKLLEALQAPFTERTGFEVFTQLPPDAEKGVPLSCSS
ncbi:protein adenylyltransferase SelO [Alteromonas sp. a30]|uniref:protein adenylyltransferase SelO n=1 Tax=Alteromonas sp. a30 TaxID=2730917 RepID=UPI00227FD3FB|nr:YdiU family protein [Alteromonas sp. a30]MCY7295715.1 YdiU family protein [Alteromonas sp. a30]